MWCGQLHCMHFNCITRFSLYFNYCTLHRKKTSSPYFLGELLIIAAMLVMALLAMRVVTSVKLAGDSSFTVE